MSYFTKYRLKNLGPLTTLGLLYLTVVGCSSVEEAPKEPEPTEMIVALNSGDEVYSFHTHQKVSDYTDRLAHDLYRNMRNTVLKQPMVVTSFVQLDDTLKKTSKLGNLISESLIGNMQEYDIPVMDIHLMGGIDITPVGDIVFSRDASDILYAGGVSYILSGVIINSEKGYTINARIMELKSKKIISTASTFIPSFVVDAI